jgi:hypothetical protein
LKESDGSSFTTAKGFKRPSDWGAQTSSEWWCSSEIIGGSQSAEFAKHNAVKGAFGFRNKIKCDMGQYLTVFIHLGHDSGANAAGSFVVPRYDFVITYNHNVSGYGADDTELNNACGDNSIPNSLAYAGGARALAYKSATTSSTDNEYLAAGSFKAGITPYVEWGTAFSGTKDDTNLLTEGEIPAWYFDNVYYPYNAPPRQGEPKSGGSQTGEYYQYCCDPGNFASEPWCLSWLANNNCNDDDDNPGFGGGCVVLGSYLPGSENSKKDQAYKLIKGSKLLLGSEDLTTSEGEVVEIYTDLQPCVRVITANGVSLECSTTAPIYTKDGDYVDAPDLEGKYVAVMIDGQTDFDEVVEVEHIGDRFVAVIDTGDNNFWAGEQPGKYMMHHNMAIFIDRDNEFINVVKK